jgi:hypothetical protein
MTVNSWSIYLTFGFFKKGLRHGDCTPCGRKNNMGVEIASYNAFPNCVNPKVGFNWGKALSVFFVALALLFLKFSSTTALEAFLIFHL